MKWSSRRDLLAGHRQAEHRHRFDLGLESRLAPENWSTGIGHKPHRRSG
jgi:hypothetical protein